MKIDKEQFDLIKDHKTHELEVVIKDNTITIECVSCQKVLIKLEK